MAKLGFSVEIPAEATEVEIEQSDVRVLAGSKATAHFGGLGPCLGVFIHSVKPRLTFACHLTAIEEPIAGWAEFERLLNGVRAIASGRGGLSAFIGGVKSDDPRFPSGYERTPQRAKQLWEGIVRAISSLGIPDHAISTCWSNNNTTIDWTIDLSNGRAELYNEPHNYDDNAF